ncbi:MAG: FkbM family methyltransferase [Pseudomonadota bacterium]
MSKSASAIQYNFSAGTFKNTRLIEGLGLQLMKLSAKMTKPIEYTGMSVAHRLLRTMLPSNRFIEMQMLPDTKFVFPYGDAYWGVLLDNSTGYSPEVENFLMGLKDEEFCFIDCGANYGYMSAIMTSQAYGSKPSIAIEADPDTYKILKANAEINKNRFEIRNRAIFSKSGEMVDMRGTKHEARSILDENGNMQNGNVETLALNDLTTWIEAQGTDKVMLKLDVEGVEIDAMKGAQELLKKDLLVFYEDHASDKSHEVSRYFMETLGMRVFYPDVETCDEIKKLEDIDKVKTNPRIGYDFAATNSPHWLKALQQPV